MVDGNIKEGVIKRYSDRFSIYGKDVRTLGWGSVEQQEARFAVACGNLQLDTKIVLDIGCGFGDFFKFCLERQIALEKYIGWDVNPDLIRQAEIENPNGKFLVRDAREVDVIDHVADVAVMIGVLNLNFKGSLDNDKFTKDMVSRAFGLCSETLVVDFLSTNLTQDYPAEDFVYYHDPVEMLAFALSLTPSVRLIHDYSPIPQKEFMLVLNHV